ncbi:hypothetical protein H6P81_015698 [Aristolochia fimbriata]|uniref:Uncharacterized protein n=1 Tax=Aristolochia fimbriata TaxID=158543 RepID=A0AAV7E6T2_ARIFI|nr:hypothetical protein H6P81_015698 [Aristolochia fimbriata]
MTKVTAAKPGRRTRGERRRRAARSSAARELTDAPLLDILQPPPRTRGHHRQRPKWRDAAGGGARLRAPQILRAAHP